MIRQRLAYLPFWIWMVWMTIMLFLPSSKVPKAFFFISDGLIHFAIMAAAVALYVFGFIMKGKDVHTFPFLRIGLLFLGYSIVIECIQEWCVPGRTGTLEDVAANMGGVLLVLLLVQLLFRYRSSFRNDH